MTGSGPDLRSALHIGETRDSGFDASHRPGMTLLFQTHVGSGVPSGGLGVFAEIAGSEIVRAQVGQFAFEALNIQPERPAVVEHQYRAAARRFPRVKLDPQ